MRTIHVGLLGCGTVGTGVARILIENRDLILSRVGAVLNLKRVADIDQETDRGIRFDEGVFISDAFKVVDDPDIDIVIEMIGGEGIAKDLILKAIHNGKPVVTANKALLAVHGNVIFRSAMEHGVDLAFEASVGGCMPIIKSLRESSTEPVTISCPKAPKTAAISKMCSRKPRRTGLPKQIRHWMLKVSTLPINSPF
jgi:homoserine dehydrogenase